MDFELNKTQKDIQKAVRDFIKGEFDKDLALELAKNHEFPKKIWQKAGEIGLIGVHFPEEYSGQGLGSLEDILVIEELCRGDSSIGSAVALSSFASELIVHYGSDEMKEKFIPEVAEGRMLSAGAFTEPDHGSDLTRMDTTLREQDDGFVLNGTKVFTTNGGYADFFIVLAQENPEAGPGKGMTTIIIERDPSSWLGGKMEINEIPDKMGLRMTSSSELVFQDLKISKENILGKRERGLLNVLDFLDESRIEIGAQALGNCEGAFLKALNHAREREQFKRPIIDFQAIGHKLARMWSQLQTLKWITYYGAWLCDNRPQKISMTIPLFTSIVKHHVPETAKSIIDDAITVFGGYGYFLDQEVERRYRDNRIIEMYEGTVEVQLNNIVRILKKLNLDFIDSELL